MIDPLQHETLRQTYEEAKQDASKAAKEFDATQRKLLDDRVAFYEKLALFDTGTIAATITMVATLKQHQTLRWENILFVGLIALLVAMALCLIRNSCAHAHLYYTIAAAYNKTHARQTEACIDFLNVDQAPLVSETGEEKDKAAYLEQRRERAEQFKGYAQKYEGMSENRFNLVKWSSWIASTLTTIGVGCILVFAIKNLKGN